MIASEIYLVRENDREMYFAHRPFMGWIFLVIGAGTVVFVWQATTGSDVIVRWVMSAGGAFFGLIGLVAAFWRYELRLELLTRMYSGRKGFLPNPKPLRGTLDEMEGVILTARTDRSDNSTMTVWTVSFGFRTWEKPVKVLESQSETAARRKFEHFAKKFRVEAVDRTGATETRTAWTELDRPLAAQQSSPSPIPPLPRDSRIDFRDTPGRRTITLPEPGIAAAGIFLILFGLPFFGMGGTALYLVLSGHRVTGSVAAPYVLGPLFMAVGLLIMFVGVSGIWGRQTIEEDGGTIRIGLLLFGRTLRGRRLAKRSIEAVEIRPVPGRQGKAQRELAIRSDVKIVTISEQGMTGQELEWLRSAVRSMAANGSELDARTAR